MNVRITPFSLTGTFKVPASKSHTIRQLLIASLADGLSEIKNPLDSLDTDSCLSVCKAFGAEIDNTDSLSWKIRGNNNFKNTDNTRLSSESEPIKIDAGNSGTTLFFALAAAGLQQYPVLFTGDEQLQKRSAAPLLDALTCLGVSSLCLGEAGCVPVTIKGSWKGGKVCLPCTTSQYLSALLIAAPLAPLGTITEINVPLLNEKPYVEMTLSYLKAHNIPFEVNNDFSHFVIPGGSKYYGKVQSVPGDFSSAAFLAAAAAITKSPITLLGLDPHDTQGDKYFFEILISMGCDVEWKENGDGKTVTVSCKDSLRGGTFDMNSTPDLLPAAAVVAAYAKGDTTFVNVAHARSKETDRIAVMAQELNKLGVSNTELPDGLIVHGKGSINPSENTVIDGHGDHRIVMAFAVAALGSPVPIEITTAECVEVSYPGFWEMLG